MLVHARTNGKTSAVGGGVSILAGGVKNVLLFYFDLT